MQAKAAQRERELYKAQVATLRENLAQATATTGRDVGVLAPLNTAASGSQTAPLFAGASASPGSAPARAMGSSSTLPDAEPVATQRPERLDMKLIDGSAPPTPAAAPMPAPFAVPVADAQPHDRAFADGAAGVPAAGDAVGTNGAVEVASDAGESSAVRSHVDGTVSDSEGKR